jgi:PEP-CTERM motif
MNVKHFAATAWLAAAATAASATATTDLGAYTLSYDETTAVFGNLAGSFNAGDNQTGFNWNVSNALSAFLVGDGTRQQVFALPSFTVTANPGWLLSGPLTGFLGNLSFTEVFGGSVTVSGSADVAINGVPAGSVSGTLPRTVTASTPGAFAQGYFSAEQTSPVFAFSSFTVSNAFLTVDLSGVSASSFAGLQGQPQNQLRLSFKATAVPVPVPEPESYALMLAGLGVMALVARRRRG